MICLVIFFAMLIISAMAIYFITNLSSQTRVALNAKKISENHRKRADFVAEQYKQERNATEKLVTRLSNSYLSEVKMLKNTFVYLNPVASMDKAVKSLQSSLSLYPDDIQIKGELAYCYFVMQQFDKVLLLANEKDERNQDLFELSKKYISLVGPNGLLSIDNLSNLILEQNNGLKRTHLIEKILAYDADKRAGDHNYEKAVKAILKIWNPNWNMKSLKYSPENQRLEVKSKDLTLFKYRPVKSSNLCILRFLNFNTLILTGSGIYDITQIDDLKNQFLDIRYTQINSLKGIEKLTHLKYLWVQKNQFSDEQLAYIPKGVKIVYK